MLFSTVSFRVIIFVTALIIATKVAAQQSAQQEHDTCLLNAIKAASPDTTVQEISETCELLVTHDDTSDIKAEALENEIGALELRETVENLSKNVPFILTAHRANYLLPAVYIDEPNSAPFDSTFGPDSLNNTEIQFQISLKAPITDSLLFGSDSRWKDSLWVGYSLRAFWQAYNTNNSRPFRETNHEPELIWETQSPLTFLGFENASNQVVINHQSNGQSGDFSRSWNRLILNSAWEKERMVVALSVWNRFKEDVETDENPRIETFLGNTQVMASYGQDNHRISAMLRGNPAEGKGAGELTWSFPIKGSDKIRGMVKYFDGYGESLLDYDVRTRSFGIGFQVTDWF